MWIPLDVVLTILIVFYQIYYRYMEILENGVPQDETSEVAMTTELKTSNGDSDKFLKAKPAPDTEG